jgi:hypothetical protein
MSTTTTTSTTIRSNTTTCVNCRKSKTRCVGGYPCTRCTKRRLPCVPTESNFGKRKRKAVTTKKRKRENQQETPTESFISNDAITNVKWSGRLDPKKHFGLNYLVRHWFSLAIRRRSTYLISRAFNLANQMGLSMDEMILPNINSKVSNNERAAERMARTTQLLLKKKSLQVVCLPRISFHQLPLPFQCILKRPSVSQSVDERWIIIRHDVDGQMGLFMSKAFERDICSFEVARETFIQNERTITSLWQPDHLMEQQQSIDAKGLGALLCQNDTKSGLPVRPFYVRQCIKTLHGEEVDVTLMSSLIIEDFCNGWIFKEYIVGHTSNLPCVSALCSVRGSSEPSSSTKLASSLQEKRQKTGSSNSNSSTDSNDSGSNNSRSKSNVNTSDTSEDVSNSISQQFSFDGIQESADVVDSSDNLIRHHSQYGGWDEDLEQLLSYHNTDQDAEEEALALLDLFE